MSYLEDMEREPYRFDFFDAMRRLERSYERQSAKASDLKQVRRVTGLGRVYPRIGSSASMSDHVFIRDGKTYDVRIGQQPHLEFPASNLADAKVERVEPPYRIRVLVKFLGMLGPQGALPLPLAEEALRYERENDDAFSRFLDLFNQRFLQLFFRAWADSRPYVQADRPDLDRFRDYVGSFEGIGTQVYKNLDSTSDDIKRAYAGLIASQTKSASRLRGFLQGLFGVRIEIDEFVGSWLEADDGSSPGIGTSASTLGVDLMVGRRIYDVQSKIRIRIFVSSLEEFERFLPSGDYCEPLADAVFFYTGDELDWDVELALPAGLARPMTLDKQKGGRLGWTSWTSPNWTDRTEYLCDARFHPAERMRRRREMQRRNL